MNLFVFKALLILSGGILYPYGWNSPEVKDACGGLSDVYKLGIW